MAQKPSYDVQEARTRIARVFRFLQELHRVKTPPAVDLEGCDWLLRLGTLPVFPSIQRGSALAELGFLPGASEARGENFILKVGRPRLTECPPPSVVIEQWLKPGWNEAAGEVKVHEKRRTTAGEEGFADSRDRAEALEQWLGLRRQWASAEKRVIEALGVFSDLFDLWGRFARESEKYQLYAGDGILAMKGPEGPVRHPVLLQKVQLGFDPGVPEFTLRESGDEPFLYTPLLRYLGVEGKDISVLRELAGKQGAHPLGGDSTARFLRTLVQQLWPDGEYFETEAAAEHPRGPVVYRQPLVYLGRSNQGFAESIDRYIEALPAMQELPEALLRVCGIETGRGEGAEGEEPPPADLLLTKHANPEQERVIHRLQETGAVLVQGPPGTGKSHTIANLIGHLLAQKKSILVTSHTSKALRVVRDHVARPLQSLCVSLLHSQEEGASQLEESITGIVNYVATTSQRKLEREIEQLGARRSALKARHDELRRSLIDSVAEEYREIEVGGEAVTPAQAARALVERRGADDWIPGPLADGAELPLPREELEELYGLNEKVSADDEKLLGSDLPGLAALPPPREFAALFDDLARLERSKLKEGGEFWIHDRQTLESLAELEEAIRAAAEPLSGAEEWLLECAEAGRRPGEREAWTDLVALVDECCREIPPREARILAQGPRIKTTADPRELLRLCVEVIEHLEGGGKLGKLSSLLKREWQQLVDDTRVDEGPPSTLEHFQAIRAFLEVRAAREHLLRRWERQLREFGGAPKPADLGPRPEKTAQIHAERIRAALDWSATAWARCEQACDRHGLDWKRVAARVPLQASTHGEILRARDALVSEIPAVLEKRRDQLRFRALSLKRDEWLESLERFPGKNGAAELARRLKHAVRKPNYDEYLEAWTKLQRLGELRPAFERRAALLARLEPAAPAWARAIAARKAPHHRAVPGGDAEAAWRYRRREQLLDGLAGVDLDRVQSELAGVKEQLHEATALYVEKLAWLAQFERTGLKQQQALNGWLALQKKMGKGTGKQVDRLREEARKTLVACRQAVPVWIMPLSRVVESFDIANTRFDVVIIDEASQSDVLGLIAFAIGREVAVVGDHEQVSPYAVGHEVQTIQGLIDEMLVDIPNRQLYDGRTSVYDLARQSFGGTIRLLEHFRCVPDIIQFSNHLCYGGEIRALREASAARVEPHLVAVHVDGGTAVNKVNREEAATIASLISAVCRIDEYEECTIGVICMVGTEQALYIDSILRRRLTVSQYQKRRLLCGNASQFQGDERDVIFISMVDSSEGRTLSMRQADEWVKVFNVAASRARDQLWVVHSLNPERDLKSGDLRLRLISHAMDPAGLRRADIREQTGFGGFASEFEELAYKGLLKADYRAVRQCRVGEYVIDLVVEGAGGRRVAVVCDGDRRQAPGELTEAMQRQTTLERLGWTFIRLRASEFLRDPERGLRKLFARLKEAGIGAIGNVVAEAPEPVAGDELMKRVLKKAELIRSRWKDTPSTPAPLHEPDEDLDEERAERRTRTAA